MKDNIALARTLNNYLKNIEQILNNDVTSNKYIPLVKNISISILLALAILCLVGLLLILFICLMSILSDTYFNLASQRHEKDCEIYNSFKTDYNRYLESMYNASEKGNFYKSLEYYTKATELLAESKIEYISISESELKSRLEEAIAYSKELNLTNGELRDYLAEHLNLPILLDYMYSDTTLADLEESEVKNLGIYAEYLNSKHYSKIFNKTFEQIELFSYIRYYASYIIAIPLYIAIALPILLILLY